MKGFYNKAVDPWRGITSLAFVGAAALVASVFGVMAMLILHQDK